MLTSEPGSAATLQWTNTAGGNWAVAGNWSPNQIPGPADDVVIDVPGQVTVSIASGTQTARSVLCRESLTLSSGSLTLSAASEWGTNGVLTISGGTLSGAGDVTMLGTLQWSNGSMEGSGRTVIGPGATATLSSSSSKGLARTLENAGSILYSGTQLYFGWLPNSTALVTNRPGALFEVNGSGSFSLNYSGAHAIHNAGTFRKSGAGTTSTFSGVAFVNWGTVELVAGTLTLPSGSSHRPGSTLTGPGTLGFANGTHVFAADVVVNTLLSAGSGDTLEFTAPLAVPRIALSGGILSGAGDLTITESLDWSNGSMEGTGRTVIGQDATATLSSGSSKGLARKLENAGSILYSGTQFYVGWLPDSTALVTNRPGALFEVSGSGTFIENYAGTHAIHNAGTFRKSGASTISTFSGVEFVNWGTVELVAGTLTLPSGSSHRPGSTLTGPGTLGFASGTHVFAADVLVNTLLSAGSGTRLEFTAPLAVPRIALSGGILSGAGDLTITESLDWSSGSMEGTGRTVIGPGATATLSSGSAKGLARTLENAGSILYSGTQLSFGWLPNTTTLVTNRPGALFEVSGSGTFSQNYSGAHAIHNAGTFRKSGDGTISTFSGVAFVNFGTVELAAGTLTVSSGGSSRGPISTANGALLILGGTFPFAEGAALLGSGTNRFQSGLFSFSSSLTQPISAHLEVRSGATLDFAAVQSLSRASLEGGILTGTGDLTITESLDWSNGSMEGTGRMVIGPGATATLSSSSSKGLARTLENAGSILYSGTQLYFGWLPNTTTLVTNRPGALFEVSGSGSFSQSYSAAHAVHNAGTFRKSGDGTTSTFSGVAFVNFGTVEVTTGTLTALSGGGSRGPISTANGALLILGGTFPFAEGAALLGSGTNRFQSGLFTFSSSLTQPISPQLEIRSGAKLDFAASQSLSRASLEGGILAGTGDLTITESLDWSDGSMEGTGRTVIGQGATAKLSSGSAKGLARTLENAGSILYSGTQFYFGWLPDSTALVTNRPGALFEVSGSGTFSQNYSGAHAVHNAGTFRKSGDGTSSGFSGVKFVNFGTVAIEAGTLTFNGYVQIAGETRLAGGVTGGNPGLQLLGGTLWGTNQIQGNLTNRAVVRPGSAGGSLPGRLLVTGVYAQESDGRLEVELGGLQATSQYDTLGVGGTAELDGTLLVRYVNNFTPASGQEFAVVTAGTRSGSFSSFQSPPGDPALRLVPTNNLVLVRAVNGPPAYPDLQVTGLTVSGDPLAAGETIQIQWFTTNAGPALTASGWREQLTVSNATTGATIFETTLFHNPVQDGVLGPAGFVARDYSVRLPDGTNGAGPMVVMVRTDVLNEIFELSESGAAEANNVTVLAFESASTDYPDLIPADVAGPATGLPGEVVAVRWSVGNAGPAPATGYWSEQLYLASDDNAPGTGLTYLGGLYVNGPIAPGTSLSRTQWVALPSLGIGAKRFVVVVDPGAQVFEQEETNNRAIAAFPITLPAALSMALPNAAYEDTPTVHGTVTRNEPSGEPLTVALSGGVPGRAQIPDSVVIAAGQVSANFQIALTGDQLALGNLVLSIVATAPNHLPVTNALTLLENDVPHLSVRLSASLVPENAGPASIQLTVTRNALTNTSAEITLSSSRPVDVPLPATLTIPPGALSASITAGPVDNSTIDGPRDVSIVATSPGLNAGSTQVEITDDDTVALSLALSEASVTEGSPAPGTLLTITRTPVTTNSLGLSLSASNSTLLQFPRSATINPGEASVTVILNVGDDDLATGPRTALILAEAESPSGAAVPGTRVATVLTVLDNDGPTLRLATTLATLAEGASTTAVLSRNTPPTNALVIALSVDAPAELQVPPSVTLPQGSGSVSFPITALADGAADGAKLVTIEAAAEGFNSGLARVSVSDIDLPDLLPVAVAPSATNGLTGNTLTASWTVANQGLANAIGDWIDRVYLTRQPFLDVNAVLVGSITNSGLIAPAASYVRQLPIKLPAAPGTYWLMVETDATSAFTESSRRNNSLASPGPITVNPDYLAEVSTEVTVSTNGTPIPLQGRTYHAADGSPAPLRPALIHIRVNGLERTIAVTSDAAGRFSAVFQPLFTEAGRYFIRAEHPLADSGVTEDTFLLVGLEASPNRLEIAVVPGETQLGSFTIRNLSREELTGMTVAGVNWPDGLSVTATTSNLLAGDATNRVGFSISTTLTNAAQVEGHLEVRSAEGAQLRVPVAVQIRPLRPQLAANPGSVERGMVRGRQAVTSFEIVNLGGAPSGDLQVLLPPQATWLSLASPATIPSLAPGRSTVVTLRLNPPADLPLGPYRGGISILGAAAGLNVPVEFRAISEAVGDLVVTVTDELTFFTSAAPRVTNATVTVRDPHTGTVIATNQTDTNGQARFIGLAEDAYVLEAQAPRHASHRSRVEITPGVETAREIFLSRETVTYRWTVVPADVPDRYRVVLESVFETEVPAPVLVVENPRIIPVIFGDEPTPIEFRIRNEGLIAFQDVRLEVPEHPDYVITPLTRTIGVLPAKSRVVIPATIQRRPAGVPLFSPAGGGGCDSLNVTAIGFYICGKDGVARQASVDISPIQAAADSASCLKDSLDLLVDAATDATSIRGMLRNLADAPCDVVRTVADCLGDESSPCEKLVLDGLCRSATGFLSGGGLGAVAGFAQAVIDNMDCVCANLPSFSSGGGGGINGSGGSGFGGGPWFTVGGGGGGGGGCSDFASLASGGVFRLAGGPEGVCARVRIRLEQEAVMTRTVFRGTLELENNGAAPLSGIQLSLDIRDEDGLSAGARFVTSAPELRGQISGVDGGGQLPAAGLGSVHYTFVPTREAAPDRPRSYRIGGTLRYLEGGQEVVVPLLSAHIYVLPEARLTLDYFQQRDVFSDDPFTEEVEPAEPFSLGLIVRNIGAGPARKFSITSAQPQIIENEKGLLIDFQLIGTQVGDQEVTPSLTATLGDIPPATARAARWLLTSTLQGRFIDYTANFEHLDALGDANVSLIESVTIHELIHAIRDDRPGADGAPDFLANDVPDADDLPDTIHFSNGAQQSVTVLPGATPDRQATPEQRTVQLSVPGTVSGWSYLRIADPGPGLRLARAVRSDGRELRVGDNVWQTDRSFPNAELGAVRERLLHLVDHDGATSYTLHYQLDDRIAPRIVSVTGPATNPAPAAIASVEIRFSEPIDGATFGLDDLVLERNGLTLDLTLGSPAPSLTAINSTTWRLGGLESFTGEDGNYTLTVLGAGIQDFGGNSVIDSATASWAKGTLRAVVVQVGPVSPNPRSTAVSAVDILFSLALQAGSFTPGDMTLARDGGPNLLGDSVTLTTLTPLAHRLSGLSALTAGEGVYVLTVNAASVTGTNGLPGIGTLSTRWTNDASGPVIASLEAIRTNPRNIVVPSLDVTFSEPILPSSFGRDDLVMTRDDGPNLITEEVTVTALSPVTWRISGLNWDSGQSGAYRLTVSATGINDLAGNPGTGSASRDWVMDTVRPEPPAQLALQPDTGISATDGLINTNRPVLTGTVGETNVTVRVQDTLLNRDLGAGPSTGLTFALPLQLEPGSRRLRIWTVDQAGNVSSNAFLNAFVDPVPPVLSLVAIEPDLQSTSVDAVDLVSTESLDPSTLTAADLILTRDNGTNLIGASVSIVALTTNTYRITGLAALNASAGRYEFIVDAAGVSDLAGNAGVGRVTNRWTRTTGNAAPIVEPLPDRVIPEGAPLTFVVTASDPDAGDRLRFELFGAPPGAVLDPVSGTFQYTPDELAGPRTNQVTVRVTDDGIPSRAASRTFRLIVRNTLPDFSVTLGSTNVFAGESNTLPIVLVSGVSLTNISLQLDLPPGQLRDVQLRATVPDLLSAQLIPLDATRHELRLGFDPTQIRNGVRRISELTFTTDAQQPSAYVRLPLSAPLGRRLSGQLLERGGALGGRVVVVRDQPVLMALPEGVIEVFGLPGANYVLERSTALPGTWEPAASFQFTNGFRLPWTPTTSGNEFFRLRQ